MTYEIEKNVPIPIKKEKEKFKRKYPFDDMEVGDSFLFDKENKERIRVACALEGKRKGKLFKVGYDSSGCLRCWRLE